MRLVTFNLVSLDGRIAMSGSTPAWLDPRWKPLERFEAVDIVAFPRWLNSCRPKHAQTARFSPATPCYESPLRRFPGLSYPHANVKYMFDIDGSGAVPGIPLPVPDDPAQASRAPVPLERLEARICELAGHLAAATCRFLVRSVTLMPAAAGRAGHERGYLIAAPPGGFAFYEPSD